jgi:hypothetical protein
LDGDSRHARLELTFEEPLADIGVLYSESAQFGNRSPPAATLTALATVPPAFVGVVRVVNIAVARTVYRYAFAGRTRLRYSGTFSQ